MKKKLLSLICLALFVASCNPDENSDPVSARDEGPNESEISIIERQEGITLFKRDIVFEREGSKATLQLATRTEEIFKNVIGNLDVIINPIYKKDQLKGVDKGTSDNEVSTLENSFAGQEIIAEFVGMERAQNVVGFRVSFRLKQLANGRVADITGYDAYVTHTSNNWPSTFYLDFPNQGGGLYMQAKWKWYNGWSSNTIIGIGSTCGVVQPGDSGDSWDVPGGCAYTWDVDGPYRCRAKIGTYSGSTGWDWEFTY